MASQEDIKKHWSVKKGELVNDGKGPSYYHPQLQRSSFDLPLWVHDSIYNNAKKEEPATAPKDQEL